MKLATGDLARFSDDIYARVDEVHTMDGRLFLDSSDVSFDVIRPACHSGPRSLFY